MSVAEIEAAIKVLPKEDLAQFNDWYRDFIDEQWDEQIRQDVAGGKFNFLLQEIEEERTSGTLNPFP